MITIKNKTNIIEFDNAQLKKDAQTILNNLDYNDFDLGILLTNNEIIHEYNKKYRKKDKPTDILSFPYHSTLKAGDRITPTEDEDKNIGDLIISLEYVQKDAPNWNQGFEQRIQVLLVHGICHLLGYDHEIDSDYEIMKKKENDLLKKLISHEN